MNNEQQIPPRTQECAAPDEQRPSAHQQSEGAEFQLTIRKLDLPVRPRGVLAE